MFYSVPELADRGNPLAQYLPARLKTFLVVVAIFVSALILLPTAYLLFWSFFGTEVVGRLTDKPTFDWFAKVLLHDRHWRDSLAYSFLVAVCVTAVGTCASCLFSYFVRFSAAWVDRVTFVAMTVAILNPIIPYGMSLRLLGSVLHLPEWLSLGLGHLAVVLPMQYLILEAARERVCDEVVWSGHTLGASHFSNLMAVFVPLNRLAIYGALVVGFFVSFDEVVVATFVLEHSLVTAPIRLWQSYSYATTPDAAVVSSLLLFLTLAAVALARAQRIRIRASEGVGASVTSLYQELVVGILVTAAVAAVMPDLEGLGGLVAEVIISLSFGTLAGFGLLLWKARIPVGAVVTRATPGKPDLNKVPRDFAFGAIESVVRRTEQLRAKTWVEVTIEELNIFARVCFERSHGAYVGTDRHVPSRYKELYPEYLQNQMRRGATGSDLRILLRDVSAIEQDMEDHPRTVLEFIKEHNVSGAMLLSVPWDVARQSAESAQLPSPDLGIFKRHTTLVQSSFSVFFDPPDRGGVGRIQIRTLESDLSQRIESFLDALIDEASLIVLTHNKPTANHLTAEVRRRLKEIVKDAV